MEDVDASAAIDLTVLEKLFGGDVTLRISILEEFCEATVGYLKEFEAAEERPAIAAVAHKLRSSSRTVGANRLADICAALELASREGKQIQIDDLLPKVEPEVRRVVNFVEGLPR